MLSIPTKALVAIFILQSCVTAKPDNTFPLIDLGYATHTPTFVNETSNGLKYASYNNIVLLNHPWQIFVSGAQKVLPQARPASKTVQHLDFQPTVSVPSLSFGLMLEPTGKSGEAKTVYFLT